MKTAVEWFEQKLDDLDIEIPFTIFEQAKKIYEEQIKDAYNQGYRHGELDDNVTSEDISNFSDAQNYYNENFKKE